MAYIGQHVQVVEHVVAEFDACQMGALQELGDQIQLDISVEVDTVQLELANVEAFLVDNLEQPLELQVAQVHLGER